MRTQNEQQPLPFPGDHLIPEPAIMWDTRSYVARDPERVWDLMSRPGLQEEGGVGWFLTKDMESFVPKKLHTINSVEDPLPPHHEVGKLLRDFPEESTARIDELNIGEKTLVLDCYWPPTKRRAEDFHYSWAIRVRPEGEKSVVESRMRFERVRSPRLMAAVGRADEWAMRRVVAKSLEQRIPLVPGGPVDQRRPLLTKRGVAAVLVGATLIGAGYVALKGGRQ